ncbi:MAG TPA: DUF4189 domain-containing protein [Pseudolabrys sp.]|nr:DUF4189 domain-containing protein [Pseudolabrys sp.]
MADNGSTVIRAVVAAALVAATTALMVVTFATAQAAGALAIGACGAYGQAYDFPSANAATERALSECKGQACRVVTSFKRGCAAYAVDGTNPCGGHGWAHGPRLGAAQNAALRGCYKDGGRDCVIRTFICDAKGG